MRASLLWIFVGWLVVFYAGWTALVVGCSLLPAVLAHWPIAVSMALGSYFAGSTPMGGGTVGFPVLVLLFDQPASLGRDFSYAVQSIGMTSASILILCRRQRLEWTMLRGSFLGTAIGTPLGLFTIAPIVPALAVKLLFAILWASFGLLHLLRLREIDGFNRADARDPRLGFWVSFAVGLVGGATVSATTGVGVDMLLYVAMVLLFRLDLQVAIPSSVLLMAFTSQIGIATRALQGALDPRFEIPREVFYNWLAAAPVVALGAPFGAVIVAHLPRRATLQVVSVLCVAQLVWTLYDQRAELEPGVVAATAGGLLAFGAFFWALHEWGGHRDAAAERPPP